MICSTCLLSARAKRWQAQARKRASWGFNSFWCPALNLNASSFVNFMLKMDILATYFGETGRNAYSRGREHLAKLLAKDEDNSVLWLHSVHHHQSREDVNYSMEVVKSYNEPLDRQLMERVKISNFKGEVLMNRRTEMGGVRVERTQYRRWGGGN